MPNSKHRKKHKEQNLKFKQKTKEMSTKNQMPQMPEVQSIPTWAPNAEIKVTGAEWEAIQNGLTTIQLAQQAAQAVMSRALVEGTIKMDFEKLDPQTLTYVPMTDEEKAPHAENFQKAIDNVKKAMEAQIEEQKPTIEVVEK